MDAWGRNGNAWGSVVSSDSTTWLQLWLNTVPCAPSHTRRKPWKCFVAELLHHIVEILKPAAHADVQDSAKEECSWV